MLTFEKLNSVNGFDKENPINAKQNNYAWSMEEYGDYIYVGTGRNVPKYVVNLVNLDVDIPLLISTSEQDDCAEIWRYKKDGTEEWKRIFKANDSDNVLGFRFMITHAAKNSSPALYAATVSPEDTGVFVYKTTDGSNWEKVGSLKGNTSRSMASYKGKLYVGTMYSSNDGTQKFLLYESEDPEFFGFKLAADFSDPSYIAEKNPAESIINMAVFNDKLYVATGGKDGIELWRTEGEVPKLNEWKRVGDKGFGERINMTAIAIGTYKDYLYLTVEKKLPSAYLLPLGAELIRIDKNDNWEIVVGGEPLVPTDTETGKRKKALSGYLGGFSNPFNEYFWQVKQYKNNLIVTTFDNGSNMEAIRDIALLNKEMLIEKFGKDNFDLLVGVYNKVLELFNKYNYPKGFSMYLSSDGVHFIPICVNGLGNDHNYGGRMLTLDSENNLYIGTANPYDGCEIYKIKKYDPRIPMGINFGNPADISKLMNIVQKLYDEIINQFL